MKASMTMVLAIMLASAPLAVAKDAEFSEKPAEAGDAEGVVRTFIPRSSVGQVKHCEGECFSDHVTRHWTCKFEGNEIVHCALHCSPPPVKGECLIE